MTAASRALRLQRWTTVLDGRQLRRLRRQRGLSQERLASRAGISLSAVARLERQSRASCRCRTLARLARALGEDPAALIASQLPKDATPEPGPGPSM
jgi:transcriptional regulator with XRE-family HTH domain